MHRRILLALALSFTAGLALVDLTCAKPSELPPTNSDCSVGEQSCGGTCVDVTTDAVNCGSCGHACLATQACSGGSCQCKSGLTTCGSSCVDLGSEAAHCGSCSTACTSAQVCNHGTCSTSCSTGLSVCPSSSDPNLKSCVDLTTNQTNCGTCGMQCATGRSCSGGQCGCPIGQTLCNGSCVDTTTSGSNCGACGHACGSTQVCNAPGVCGCTPTQVVCANQSCAATPAACNTGMGGAGGGGMGGAGGGGMRPPGCAAGPNVIADFEDGTDTEVVQGGRTGWWFTFADTLGGSIVQAPNQVGPIAAAMVPTTDTAFGMCNHFALHVTATGRTGGNTAAYAGFGASIAQVMPTPPAGSRTKTAYDLSAYKGISFSIKSGTANPPPIWFEVVNTETAGTPDGTATHTSIDLYNTRGKLLTDPLTNANLITTAWQTITVPFGLFGPRYLPACTANPAASPDRPCTDATYEAPIFNPKSALGLQFAMYPQFTNASAFDIWIDNVQLVTDDTGVATFAPTPAPLKPFPRDAAVGTCTKPTGASGKFLVDAYLRWKRTFVTGTGNATRVQRPENGNDTVSEGIAYGMLIAAIMGDKTLFDGLWGYWSAHLATGMLMNWTCPGGASCSGGSATDADEDAAYALLLASKQWGGSPAGGATTYISLATTMIGQIWTTEIDATARLPRGGNNYANVNAPATNPSYFAPAYYRIFGTIDTAAGHSWALMADQVYTPLNAGTLNKGGLIPAWCASNCTVQGTNANAADDALYQYDAHRIPWRVGLDACWFGTAAAKTFLTGNTGFFVRKAMNGLGNVFDRYGLDGNPAVSSTPAPQHNSMSAIGTAAVGAMGAGNADFMNRAYRFLLDANYTADPPARMTAYTYFNASVGLLTALTLTGNFPDYRNF